MNIVLGLALVIGIMSFALTVLRDIGTSMIFNFDAFMIVIGGTTIAMFIGFPVQRLRHTFNEIIGTFAEQRSREDVIRDILDIARMYRRTDIRSIENRMNAVDDHFLRMGVNLLINNHSNEEISSTLEREMMLRVINSNFSQNVIKTIARLTPSFGLAGTIISLIKMFRHLDSIESIAPMMAVALMSTFYGVIIANLFMMPLNAKIRERAILSEASMNLTIEGIMLIQKREHPLKIEEKLGGYQVIDESAQGLPQMVTANLMSNAG
jgi:chemotaxis protein MotA